MVIRIKLQEEFKQNSDLSDKDLCLNMIIDICSHIINILNAIDEEYTIISSKDAPFQE